MGCLTHAVIYGMSLKSGRSELFYLTAARTSDPRPVGRW